MSWQAGDIFETPSTWLTLFAPPWRSPEVQSTQIIGPPKLLTETFPYEWLVLAHASQTPIKQTTAGLSNPPATILLAKGPQAWH